jgi:cytochrome c553
MAFRNRIMMKLRLTLFSAAFLYLLVALAPAAAADDGQKTFTEQKCNKCHSVASVEIEATIKSEKMRGPDLSKAGEKHAADWVKQYVLKEVQLNDKDHKAKWEGSEKDLQAIADWIASLK